MDLTEYRDIFISEAQEYLQSLNQGTLRLEKNRGDLEAVHQLFRAAHTLKGMAATMGFDAITELAHEMENLLDPLRSGSVQAEAGLVNLLFSCIDALSGLIGTVAGGGQAAGAPADLVARIKAAAEGGLEAPAPAHPLAAPQPAPAGMEFEKAWARGLKVYHLAVTLEKACAFKGVRAFMVLRGLEKLAEVLGAKPDTKTLETGSFEGSFELWLASAEEAATLKSVATKVLEVAEASVETLAPAFSLDQAASPVVETPAPKPNAASPAEIPKLPEKPAEAAGSAAAAKPSIRVPVDRLDVLMNLVGELVTHKIRLGQIGKEKNLKELKDSLGQLERVVNELQDEVMSVRMVPMDHIFNRFPRMVRDLARELGKEVELDIVGKEIELDRTVLEEISDPLVHILRNAIDHGVESPAARARSGKGPAGIIRLEARREKNQVLIIVEDDGAGIDPQRIRKAAVEKGFLEEARASDMADAELLQLIFLPGFSTAGKVTNLSGRGVGLDVVKNKIESFGGTVRMESRAGAGTKFILRLPLTLAIIQALLVRLSREIYAVPVANTTEVVEYAWEDLRAMQGQEIVLLRGQVLPLVRLGALLAVPQKEGQKQEGGGFTVLVGQHAERRLGFMVDEVLGQQEIAIKSLGRFLKGIKGFGGVTVLGDGRIALILDIPSLMEAGG